MTDLQKRWALVIAALLLALVYLLQPILTPFLVGALLAYLGDPLADRLEAMRLSRTAAVCVVFFVLTLIAVLTMLITIPLVGRQLDLLINKLPLWIDGLQQLLLPYLKQHFDVPSDSLQIAQLKSVIAENWAGASNLLNMVWKQVASSSMALVIGLTNLLLIPVVTFYLLRDWDVLMEHIRNLLPRSTEKTVVKLGMECDEIIGAFIRGQLLVMLALGVVYSIGLWIVGLDLALILGLTAGLASVVPYMGFIVGISIATLAAFFQFHAWMPILGVGVVFTVGQLLEGMVLTPLLVGDRIGLHPVAVIFAIMAGGQLFGFTGVLLALPAAAVIMVLLRHAHRNYKDSELYAADS